MCNEFREVFVESRCKILQKKGTCCLMKACYSELDLEGESVISWRVSTSVVASKSNASETVY